MVHKRLLLLSCAALVALSVGCADNNVYAMSEKYEIDGDERIYAGGGCTVAIERGLGSVGVSGQGGRADGDLTISEQSGGKSFVVVVSSQGEELARRDYKEKALLSGERDKFTVTTKAGREFELTYWGGHECDTSHLPEDL